MKIAKDLNLVVPVDSAEGEVYFHSTPILRETFQRYHFVICKAFSRLIENGLQLTGAKIAAMTLEEVAVELGKWEGDAGVKAGLMEEIARLTSAIVLTESGWQSLPVEVAIKRGLVEDEDWQEAKQRIVFFTLICAMTRAGVRNDLLEIMADSWQTQTVSSNSTEFAASLPILTETETSSQEGKQSSLAC